MSGIAAVTTGLVFLFKKHSTKTEQIETRLEKKCDEHAKKIDDQSRLILDLTREVGRFQGIEQLSQMVLDEVESAIKNNDARGGEKNKDG
jgi:hypothetical protein